jgi:hypothetical protein
MSTTPACAQTTLGPARSTLMVTDSHATSPHRVPLPVPGTQMLLTGRRRAQDPPCQTDLDLPAI